MIGPDRDADRTDGDRDGRRDRGDRRGRGDRWAGTATFALALLVASLVPVSWVAPGGGAGGGGSAGGAGDAVRDALPVEVVFTDPFHLVGYALLAALASRALGGGRRGLLLAVAAAVAFGFGIELVQAPIPWRSFAWRDAAVNAVGAVGGAGAYRLRRFRRDGGVGSHGDSDR
ncbi:VanZ family protein [Halorubrum kocurii]|uniref:VanZ family protein n=1 Tax=Halorubrum kocurii TaxID=478441 RepID=UPI0006778F6A|nr:VanZ family protein [Halorubrum kocurii]